MAEVLTKVEKYIKGEEALISKRGSSSTHKEKSRTDKKRERSPRRQGDRERSPRRDREQSPKEVRERQRPPGTTLARATATVFTSAIHPPDSHSITGLARGTT